MSELSVKQKIQLIKNIAERNNVINSTDALFAINALESRIAELESRRVRVELPAEKFCPAEYAGSQLWDEIEIWNKAISECANRIERALSNAGIECEVV